MLARAEQPDSGRSWSCCDKNSRQGASRNAARREAALDDACRSPQVVGEFGAALCGTDWPHPTGPSPTRFLADMLSEIAPSERAACALVAIRSVYRFRGARLAIRLKPIAFTARPSALLHAMKTATLLRGGIAHLSPSVLLDSSGELSAEMPLQDAPGTGAGSEARQAVPVFRNDLRIAPVAVAHPEGGRPPRAGHREGLDLARFGLRDQDRTSNTPIAPAAEPVLHRRPAPLYSCGPFDLARP